MKRNLDVLDLCSLMMQTTGNQLQMLNVVTGALINSRKKYRGYENDDENEGTQDQDRITLQHTTWTGLDLYKRFYGKKMAVIDVSPSGDYPMFSTSHATSRVKVPFATTNKQIYARSIESLFEGMKVYDKDQRPNVSNLRLKPQKRDGTFTGLWFMRIGSSETLKAKEAHMYFEVIPYKAQIEGTFKETLQEIQNIYSGVEKLVILDSSVETDFEGHEPLSGGYLLKLYLENKYPQDEEKIIKKEKTKQ